MTRLHLMASRLRGLAILAYLAYLQPALTQFLDPKVCSLDYHGSVLGRRPELSTCPLPVDEDSAIDTGNWQPWKRRPYCIDSLQFEQHPPEFCVYAFEPFRGDKGISVITTPVLAASMVDALDDSVVPPKLRNHPSSSLAREGQGSTAYVMKDIPGKGKGLVATRPIRKWDLVIVEYPAMLAHMGVFEVVGSEMRQEILERALHLLPEKQQSEIMSLARKMIDEPIEDILRTNIFGVELGIEIPHLGLFPIASVSSLYGSWRSMLHC
ncbi:hypothetical protein F5Y04DRAFT_265372 [Hypomontagnella monticulosa]|nr:hypothetical protein F5Y04DRAFT_265372 [Hypomontagnella monticulosa]